MGIDADARVWLANPRAADLFGFAAPNLVGSSIQRLLPGLGLAPSGAPPASLRVDTEGNRSDGSRFRAHVSLTPFGTGFVALVQDATQDLGAGERAALAEAERAHRMKDDFLATLSHELRTPLNAMLGWTQLLRTHGTDTEIGARAVDTIERNIQIQTRLIEGLLDLSSIASGKLRLDIRRVSLVPVIEAALEMVMPAARFKEIELVREFEADLPDVLGDAHRLQQIVWNLLSNAVKFSPLGGTVRVSLRRLGSSVRMAVTDTGEGIEPALLDHMFEPFRQADSSPGRRYGGLGLGLSIVKSLVEMHGGEVRAESAGTGAGATFTVMLPLSSPRDAVSGEPTSVEARPQSPAHASAEALARIERVRVLVVEDDEDARAAFRQTLEDAGATVLVAASAAEALALLAEHHPDVMLCDVGLPGEDGYRLMRRVRALDREEDRDIPAAALTAFARDEDRARAVESGFQIHVRKPVARARLLEVVGWLAMQRLR